MIQIKHIWISFLYEIVKLFIMLLLQDTESVLSRQSLYVRFDPLVEQRKSLGNYCDLNCWYNCYWCEQHSLQSGSFITEFICKLIFCI